MMRKLPYVGDRIVFPGNSIDYLYQRHVVRQLLGLLHIQHDIKFGNLFMLKTQA